MPSGVAVRLIAVSYAGMLGGAERMLVELAAGLPEPPDLAAPEGALAEAARARGLGVFELRERSLDLRARLRDRASAPGRIAAQAGELRALLASTRPDAVLAWGMRAGAALSGALAADRRRAPLLFQHHDLLPGPLIARATRIVAGRAALVVVPSACVAGDLDRAGTLRARLRVVPPGVDLERFRPRAISAGSAATRVAPGGSGRDRRCTVLTLGAVERWKQPQLALEAIALAARELPGLRLRLAGEPIGADGRALLHRLHRRASEPDLRGRVEFAGWVPDPERELASADCLLHPAAREPYGMVVAEAMACGVPVVVSDSCGPAEIFDQGCGSSYEAGSPAAAARALVDVLAESAEAARLGDAARAAAERRLDILTMQARYAELVEELCAVGGRKKRSAAPIGSAAPPGQRRPAARLERRSTRSGAGLAVVTVLHDSEPELTALLASLERHLPAAQVVVVDCASSDCGVALARGWRGGAAEVLELGENAGFGRGVNAGIQLVRRPATALLNPDVELVDSSLEAAAREALRDPARLIAPLVLRPDGSREDNAQREPGSLALLTHALLPGALLPRRVAALIEPWRAHRPRRAGWAVASCLTAATQALRRLGPFDQRAFMYAEDLDLCLRARDAGMEILFWPAARVVHQGGHSARRAFGGEPFELLARRRRDVVRERRGRHRARADELLRLVTFADRLVLKGLAGRSTERDRRQLQALRRVRRESRR